MIHPNLVASADWTSIFQFLLIANVTAVAYTYVGYPLLLFGISLCRRRRTVEQGYLPFVSVLIAAYNEERSIGTKIEQTLALDYPPDLMEVLVLSDCSSDHTDDIVRCFTDRRVRLVRIPERHGKTHAQNEGAIIAKGSVLIFSDATTVYHPQALRLLASHYQDPKVGAVTGRNLYFDRGGNSPTGAGTVLFWNYENLIKIMQSRISTLTGCVGCIYSVRTSAYTPLPDDVISDLVQPLKAIQKGYRVAFEGRALAHEETTNSSPEEFAMRVRVVTRGMRGLLTVPDLFNPLKHPWVSFQLISHKVLRWIVPFFLLVAFLSTCFAGESRWVSVAFWLQASFYLLALLPLFAPLHKYWKVLAIPHYFCTLNAAALVSLIELLRGKKYTIWQTVRKAAA
jgi:cellulose synthase/poly-beta-1,6-N-acetylglucosamine synthase-like glycosyltransferase